MLRRNLFLPAFLLLSVIMFGQETNYNLPPGFYHNESIPVLDLSYKLEGFNTEKDLPDDYLRILKEIPDSRLGETSPEYQKYVKQGKKYINSLSGTVRNIYTDTELWYIYAYDPVLKNKLKKVK